MRNGLQHQVERVARMKQETECVERPTDLYVNPSAYRNVHGQRQRQTDRERERERQREREREIHTYTKVAGDESLDINIHWIRRIFLFD